MRGSGLQQLCADRHIIDNDVQRYGLDRIHHVGAFPELEQQMCLMTASGYQGDGSPDRVDALVWLFSELFPKMTRREPSTLSMPTRANSKYRAHRLYG